MKQEEEKEPLPPGVDEDEDEPLPPGVEEEGNISYVLLLFGITNSNICNSLCFCQWIYMINLKMMLILRRWQVNISSRKYLNGNLFGKSIITVLTKV